MARSPAATATPLWLGACAMPDGGCSRATRFGRQTTGCCAARPGFLKLPWLQGAQVSSVGGDYSGPRVSGNGETARRGNGDWRRRRDWETATGGDGETGKRRLEETERRGNGDWRRRRERLAEMKTGFSPPQRISQAPGWCRTYRNETCRSGSPSDPAGTRRIACRAALRGRRGADAAAPSNAPRPPRRTKGGRGSAWCLTRLLQVSYKGSVVFSPKGAFRAPRATPWVPVHSED